jgi:transcriptional regulator with XRE-family HTH domain
MERFSEKLRALRLQHGMSHREIAKALGFSSHSFIYKLETGQKKPNAELLVKVSRLFDVPVDVLVKDEEEL